MSRSRRIFRLIEASLPGVVLCKDMLVVPPTRHIVRGFLLEATTEKGRVYLWRVVTPLYRPMSHVILNYSVRIPKTGEIYVKNDAPRESADLIRGIIAEEHIAYLRGIETPADFLRHASWIGSGSPLLSRVDRALTYCLMGDAGRNIESLRALKAEADQLDVRRREYIAPLLEQAVSALDSPAGLVSLLRDWENQNVERLGLQKSRTLPDVISPASV